MQQFKDVPQFDENEATREMAKELSAKGKDLIKLLETNFPTNYPDANAKIHPDMTVSVLAPPMIR